MKPGLVKAGVMGWPVAHSRSPLIHNHWLNEHGIAGTYELMPTPLDELEGAVQGLRAAGFSGCNLTIPHKVAVLPMLDSLTPAAKAMGAANVIAVQPDGSLLGHNTDAFGYIQNLHETAPTWQPGRGAALVLGAGGAARAVAYALAQAGVPELLIANRSLDKAQELAQAIGSAFAPTVCAAVAWDERARPELLQRCALLVNTTELGMQGKAALEMPLADLPGHAVVSDIVYAPLVTPLLRAANAQGLATSDGLGMLLYQAQAAFKLWFGVEPAVTAELRAKVVASFAA